MALEKIETLTSIKTRDGLIVTNKVVASLNGNTETYYFSYIINEKRQVVISEDVRSDLKNLKIESVVIDFLTTPFVLDKIAPI